MKILSILASPAPGGAEMLVRNLGAELVRRGHDCHVLFMSHAQGVGNPADFEGGFLRDLEQGGMSFDLMSPRSFRSILGAAREFRRVAKAFRPDIVHAHLARGVLCRSFSGLKLPTIYTHHNVVANFPTLLFKLFNRTVDHYVTVSAACSDFLVPHVRGPITTIPNGVPVEFAADRPRERISRPPLVLAVGALRAAKDYPTLIEAASIVASRLPPSLEGIRFAIAGDGVERPRLEQLIEQRGLSSLVTLLGARGDVAALMKEADLLVNSSTREGLPIALIEASLSGLPIVAADVGGNAEVVADGVNGFLVPPMQPETLAGRILDVLGDEARYREFSRAAIVQAQKFTMAACVESHLRVYESVLGK